MTSLTSSSGPAIILVRPQMGENIGAVARAMMNFGLIDLRLVAPRDGWPNPKAHEMAAHADGLIERARVVDALPEALADCHFVLAASARVRDMALPLHDPEAAARLFRRQEASGARTALLLGAESTGLTNDELAHAHAAVCIPTDPANASLNIAQALVVLAYAWFRAGEQQAPAEPWLPAPRAEVEGLFQQLVNQLEDRQYFHPDIKREGLMRALRLLIQRAPWSSQEIRTLRGILKTLGNRPKT